MAKRGKVLRDPIAGPGLLMVEGQQHQFTLEGIWRSEVPAKPGLPVDVEFEPGGKIISITAIPESQLAKEQAEAALKVAREQGSKAIGQIVARVGMPALVAGAVLLISWFWFTTVSVQAPFGGKIEFTFWQILGFLNASNFVEVLMSNGKSSSGMYGFLALVALGGPFVRYYWKDKRAPLGGLLPLLFIAFVGFMVYSSLNHALGGPAQGAYAEMQSQMRDEAMKAISMGAGLYLSVLASLYFAGVGIKNYLISKATEEPPMVERAAA